MKQWAVGTKYDVVSKNTSNDMRGEPLWSPGGLFAMSS